MPEGMQEPRLTENLFKLVIVGDYGVGKSCLVSRFCDNFFRDAHATTIGIDYKVRSTVLPEYKLKVKLEIFDTAGLEKFRPIASAYYQNASGVIIVYDVTNPNSFANVEKYLRELRFYIPPDAEILLVGNKCDLSDDRKVSYGEAEKLSAKVGISLFETSAATGEFVEEAFLEIAHKIQEKIQVGTFDTQTLIVTDSAEKTPNAWCVFCRT